jgi:lysophospholipase L1-like esterase
MTALWTNEADDPDVLGVHEEHALLRGAPWRRFAVVGDSIAEGVGDPVDGYRPLDWSRRVARGLRSHHPELAYLNLGVRGLRAREVRETQLVAALDFAPDLAAVCAGGNDTMARRFDADALEQELDELVGALREAGADVLLFTLMEIGEAVELPDPWGTRLGERMAQLASVTRSVARRHDALLAECAGHPRAADPSVYSADMLHLNMRGHAVVAGVAMRALARDRVSLGA